MDMEEQFNNKTDNVRNNIKERGRDFMCVYLTLTFDKMKTNNIILNYNSVDVEKEPSGSREKIIFLGSLQKF